MKYFIRYSTTLLFILLEFNIVIAETLGDNQIQEYNQQGDRSGWMKSLQTIVSGPAGQFMVLVAKDLISRSAGNSQILSLNITNLIVLVLLKALIFAAGLIGSGGNWSNYARGRSYEEAFEFNRGEPELYVGYLAAIGSGQTGCLYKAACQSPVIAGQYASAGRALLGGIATLNENLPDTYDTLIQHIEKGSYDSYKGFPCDLIYKCDLF